MAGKKVLVGMSGGTDSFVACLLLRQQGFEPVGLTLVMWTKGTDETEPAYVKEARQLAASFAMPHYTLDVSEQFRHSIVGNFVSEYMQGRTPNPCVQCNRHIKLKYLLAEADRLGCEYIATGHYAQVMHTKDCCYVAKGVDVRKDQSYFLWGVEQHVLQRLLLPLGGLTKQEVRRIAMDCGFERIAQKADSQDICFVEGNYRDFLRTYNPEIDSMVGPGKFVNVDGRVLGAHKGYPFYTIGQRKGLEIALGVPAYVLRIDAAKNEITIGDKQQLLTSEMQLSDCCFSCMDSLSDNEVLLVKIRYKSMAVQGYLEEWTEHTARVRFVTPIEAVTPGQSAVLYRNECVVGGGIIMA